MIGTALSGWLQTLVFAGSNSRHLSWYCRLHGDAGLRHILSTAASLAVVQDCFSFPLLRLRFGPLCTAKAQQLNAKNFQALSHHRDTVAIRFCAEGCSTTACHTFFCEGLALRRRCLAFPEVKEGLRSRTCPANASPRRRAGYKACAHHLLQAELPDACH